MSIRRRGFTFIELIVVLVILGILAAFAVPRFVNIAQGARISALDGLAGTLRDASKRVHDMALARNVTTDNPSTGLVPLEGTNIDVVNVTYTEPAAASTSATVGAPVDGLLTYAALPSCRGWRGVSASPGTPIGTG